MTTVTLVLATMLVLGALTVLLSWTAGRHDRLHIRLTTAETSLELQLADRVTCTMRIASSPLLDPASAVVLLAAAEDARAGHAPWPQRFPLDDAPPGALLAVVTLDGSTTGGA